MNHASMLTVIARTCQGAAGRIGGSSRDLRWLAQRERHPGRPVSSLPKKIIPAYGRCFRSISASLKLEEEAPRLHFGSLISDRIRRPRLESIFWAGC